MAGQCRTTRRRFVAFLFHWQRLLFLYRIPILGAVGFHPVALANFGFLIAIVIVIFLHFARVSRSEARVAAELDAAREIQRTRVRIDLPEIEGYRLAAAYFPAAEVGGDFYKSSGNQMDPRLSPWVMSAARG
jgi:hypothetical protein